MQQPVIETAHQVVAQGSLLLADGFGLLQHGADCLGGAQGDGQFFQDALAKLEDGHVVDALPYPAPMCCNGADEIGFLLHFAQRADAAIGHGQLFLKDERIGQDQGRDLGGCFASPLGFVRGLAFWRRDTEQVGQPVTRPCLPKPELRNADQSAVQGLGRVLDNVVLAEHVLRSAQGFHECGRVALEPFTAFGGFGDDAVAQTVLPSRCQAVWRSGSCEAVRDRPLLRRYGQCRPARACGRRSERPVRRLIRRQTCLRWLLADREAGTARPGRCLPCW